MSLSPGEMSLTWEQRFWNRVTKTDACWLWRGGRGAGYGVYMWPGQRRQTAHAIAYQLERGPIPAGMVIDHLCLMRLCVNPAHLEPVTPQENRRRQRLRQTHCKRGHPLIGENLYTDKRGHRSCISCRREAGTW